MTFDARAHNDGIQELHFACRQGRIDLVVDALRRGVSPDLRDEKERTPLHYAAASDEVEAVNILLAKGANKNALNSRGWTPLHEACHYNSLRVVVALLEADADLSHTSGHADSPAHAAAHSGHAECIKRLLCKDPTLARGRNARGHTIMHETARKGHLKTAEYLFSLDDYRDELLCPDYDGRRPIHLASMNGHEDVVRFFLETGSCDPSETDRKGQNCHDLARDGEHQKCAWILYKPCCEKSKSCHPRRDPPPPLTDGELDYIAAELVGDQWKSLARRLGVSEVDVQNTEYENDTVKERAVQALSKWKRNQSSSEDSRATLAKELESLNLKALIPHLRGYEYQQSAVTPEYCISTL